jgi:hypothetical protein
LQLAAKIDSLDHHITFPYSEFMITGKHIREWLNASPFKPFRIGLSDGSHHDIVHPELAWVLGNRVFVGERNGATDPNDYTARQLSILHISRIEELPSSRRHARK